MMNPIAQRHLRDAPSAPIVRSFSEVPSVAGTQRSKPPQQPEGIHHITLGERCLSTLGVSAVFAGESTQQLVSLWVRMHCSNI